MQKGCSSQEFAAKIREELDKGYGFIPLVGSGLSVASGIPTGEEIGDYLFGRVPDALSYRKNDDGKPTDGWNPRSFKWPTSWQQAPPQNKWEWIRDQIPEKDKPRDVDHDVITPTSLEAIGAAANWRSTLHFLSRLEYIDGEVTTGAPDYRVVDSFFVHLTGESQPNVAHSMLAFLSGPLRIHTLLTTNFDSLIEAAFERLQMPLTTFDVHQKAGLPEPKLVLAQRSIVKLHGGRYGLRADFSLDEQPSDGDKEAFAGYFRGLQPVSSENRNHLLVLGTHVPDRRTLNLIGAALETNPEMKIFWTCYGKRSIEAVQKQASKLGINKATIVPYRDAGLFLLEMYQHLVHSLPPGGTSYPAFWHVPPDPYDTSNEPDDRRKALEEHRKEFRDAIDNQISSEEIDVPSIMAIHGKAGASTVAAKVYDDLCDKYHCLWLEMDDFCGPPDFFAGLLEAVAYATGAGSAMPPTALLGSDDAPEPFTLKSCNEDFKRYLDRALRPLVIFLHGRDGLGTAAGSEGKEWEEPDVAQFWRLLNSIHQKRVCFVPLVRENAMPQNMRDIKDLCIKKLPLKSPCISFNKGQIADSVSDWLKNSPEDQLEARKRFLYALTLFRHSRHPAALCSWALIIQPSQKGDSQGDDDEKRAKIGRKWLDDLLSIKAIRDKPGGFAWMHRDVKEAVLERLQTDYSELTSIRAECHQGIADWYAKLFRSSDDPLAALESVFHRLNCVDNADEDYLKRGDRLIESSLIEAIATLRLARPRILSRGYFKASIGLIAGIKEKACELKPKKSNTALKDRAEELGRICQELERDFSAEVADFDEAIKLNSDMPAKQGQTSTWTQSLDEDHCSYKKAVYLTGLRAYSEAEKEFLKVLRSLKLNISKFPGKVKQIVSHTDARSIGVKWAASKGQRLPREKLELAVRVCRRFMVLQMLMGQIEQLRGNVDPQKARLEYATRIYALTTEIMRYIDDSEFLQRENTYLRTHYGVILCNLGRHGEAHRRLNEAEGYLSHSEKRVDQVIWGVIDLRRAEIYIRQSASAVDRAKDNPDQRRLALALLDSAHRILERARARLTGQRKDMWWWTWMHELQLTVCVQLHIADLCQSSTGGEDSALACSLCSKPYERFIDLFCDYRSLVRLDVVRHARISALLCDLSDTEALRSGTVPTNLRTMKGLVAEQMREVWAARKKVNITYGSVPEIVEEYFTSQLDRCHNLRSNL